MDPLKTIAFVVNQTKAGAAELAQTLVTVARDAGADTRVVRDYPLPAGSLAGRDAACVIGGDGSILGTVDEAVRENVPVMGINLGKLGFMATFNEYEAASALPDILAGKYQIGRRSLLNCMTPDGTCVQVLNDVVIKAPAFSGLIELEVRADGQQVARYSCDGLIFSTPTGSTAYNLSAGGPILQPEAEAIAMTPICPHTLSNRSVVFTSHTRLEVFCRNTDSPARISLDGRESLPAENPFPLRISLSEKTFPLMHGEDYAHFSIIRSKLDW
ncbi:MAG: NAD(+)/NADH kinase [Opitutales bacterium]